MKILFFSNLHLGKRNNNLFFLDLDLLVINKIIDFVKKEDIKKIVFLGDFFNQKNYLHSITLYYARNILDKLNELNIPILMLLGPFDIYLNSSKLYNHYNVFKDLYKNIFFIKDFFENDIIFYLSFLQNKNDFNFYKNNLLKNKIICGHFIDSDFYDVFLKFKNNIFINGYSHKRLIKKNIIEVGSPYPQSWDDLNSCNYGFMVYNLDNLYYDFYNLHLYHFNIFFYDEIIKILNSDDDKEILFNSEVKIIINKNVSDEEILNLDKNLKKYDTIRYLYYDKINEENKKDLNDNKIINFQKPIVFIYDYLNQLNISLECKERLLNKINEIIKNE